ncbi:hypothetical protein EJ06DRAFT_532688 [Trichodelitschia bisporula]|uniref:Glutamate--tRNA ligase, mitochondrial n=1 Tax=Trichodelitschia bisporula TaxID=703511 RepID=A0A6G1HPL6_9PEZI|nr:hypothetical protein EJ06DRAFT_532688 [Trichodelitschia bisporula]
MFASRFKCTACRRRLLFQSEARRYASKKSLNYLPDGPVRTRFAPSPTGHLHLGSIRTALFNYLLARRTGGQFILRIEDTDEKRTVPGAEERIIRDLRWAGLQWDEGPEVEGPYGPYKQSLRTMRYREHAEQLIASGYAYRCFCPAHELRAKAEARLKQGLSTEYDRTCIHIPAEESADRAHRGETHIVRLKDPTHQPDFRDLVFGRIRNETRKLAAPAFEDPVLLKSDGLPTYHLANVVDDHHMRITHVIRGVEWMISTRKHVTLYNAFGWTPPAFAHVGLLLDAQGNKLSKRDKAFDIGVMQAQGVLPEALDNFLALLGWSHQDGQGGGKSHNDFMTMADLERKFNLRLTKTNPVVNLDKLWFLAPKHAAARLAAGGPAAEALVDSVFIAVQNFIQDIPLDARLPITSASPEEFRAYVAAVLQVAVSRFTSAQQFAADHQYFWLLTGPAKIELAAPANVQKLLNGARSGVTEERLDPNVVRARCLWAMGDVEDAWTVENLTAALDGAIAKLGKEHNAHVPEDESKAIARLVWGYLRGWIAWGMHGPGVVETMILLGPEVTLSRMMSEVNAEWIWEGKERKEEKE